MTGFFESNILLAPMRKVPSPPVVTIMSAHLTNSSVYSWFLLTKVSRYEFERLRHESLTEAQLEHELTARGSNYIAIKHHHNIHKSLELSVVEALERAGIETKAVSYTHLTLPTILLV